MNTTYRKAEEVFATLPQETKSGLLPLIREEFLRSGKTIVVLDDDPTGTQTCYDVVVLTSWTRSLLVEELRKKPSILFILTNSRSLTADEAIRLAYDIGENLVQARKESGREIVIISRSDSTLRGHFPAEVDAIASALGVGNAVRVLIPAFIEGGRYTIGDVHYIREQDNLVPVSDTPFAKDTVFGYKNANLKDWVQEKTNGRVTSSEVVSISIEDIRLRGTSGVLQRLKTCLPGGVCIVNACSHKDLEVIVAGLLEAERDGQKFIYRTSATFVSIRAGLQSGKVYEPSKSTFPSDKGSLVIVGSYVPKTTRQLNDLLLRKDIYPLEIQVLRILGNEAVDSYRAQIIHDIQRHIDNGQDVVIYTSRSLQTGGDAAHSLLINRTISTFLVNVVKGLLVRPAFIIAKGGITSSDIATKGLGAKKALVLGQIIPGVPVWQIDDQSKFPQIIYIVFPGNVGDDQALTSVRMKLKTD